MNLLQFIEKINFYFFYFKLEKELENTVDSENYL